MPLKELSTQVAKHLVKTADSILQFLIIKLIRERTWKREDINSLCWLSFAEFSNYCKERDELRQ